MLLETEESHVTARAMRRRRKGGLRGENVGVAEVKQTCFNDGAAAQTGAAWKSASQRESVSQPQILGPKKVTDQTISGQREVQGVIFHLYIS